MRLIKGSFFVGVLGDLSEFLVDKDPIISEISRLNLRFLYSRLKISLSASLKITFGFFAELFGKNFICSNEIIYDTLLNFYAYTFALSDYRNLLNSFAKLIGNKLSFYPPNVDSILLYLKNTLSNKFLPFLKTKVQHNPNHIS